MKTIKFLALSLVALSSFAFDAAAEVEKVKQYKNTPDSFFYCLQNSDKSSNYLLSKEVLAACIQGSDSIQLVQKEDGSLSLVAAHQQIFRKEKQSEYENYTAPDHSVVNIIGLDFGDIDGYALSTDKKLTTNLNLFFGQDSTKWGTSEIFGELNINLVGGNVVTIYQKDGNIAYDITVKNGLAPRLAFVGGDSKLDASGNLEVVQGDSKLVSLAPVCYSGSRNADKEASRNVSKCSYLVGEDKAVSFATEESIGGEYVVDPGVVWLSLFGVIGVASTPSAIEVSSDGGVVMAGYAPSGGLPATTAGVYSVPNPSDTAFLTKFLADGSGLAFHTIIGGTGSDSGTAMTIDPVTQDIILGGVTGSSNFPVTVGAYDTTYNNGTGDIFIARFNSDATSLVFSTYLGGSDLEGVLSLKISSISGDLIFAGQSKSTNFPTANAFQASKNGTGDAVIGKLSSNGATLISSTFLGGSETSIANYEQANSVFETPNGDLYFVGLTFSSSFPVSANVMDITFNGTTSLADGFVGKWDGGSGASKTVSFIGGAGRAPAAVVSMFSDGTVGVLGNTFSSSFTTTAGAYNTTFSGTSDTVFVKMDQGLSTRLYSTLLGGNGSDTTNIGNAKIVSDSVLLCGSTTSTNLPVTLGAYDTTFAHAPTNPSNLRDTYITKFAADQNGIYAPQYLTYFGSLVGNDDCKGIVAKPNGNVIVAGSTNWVFANPNNLQATAGAYSNSGGTFVTEMSLVPTGANIYGVSSDTSVVYNPTMDINSSPYSGNSNFAFQLRGAPPGALCLLGASVVPDVLGTDLYGIKWHLDILSAGLAGILFLPDINYPMLTDAAGNITMPLPLPIGIAGLQVCFQWFCFWFDNLGLQLAASNAIDVTIQP